MNENSVSLNLKMNSIELLEKASAGIDDIELPQDEVSPMTEALGQLGENEISQGQNNNLC